MFATYLKKKKKKKKKKKLVFYEKIKEKDITKFKDVIESYWSDVAKFQGANYNNFKFIKY